MPDCYMHFASLLSALFVMPAAGKLAARVDRTVVVGTCELPILLWMLPLAAASASLRVWRAHRFRRKCLVWQPLSGIVSSCLTP